METLIDTLKIFESNMGKTAHMQGLFDDVASHLFSQLRFPEHSISEVWIFMTSIFLSGQRVNDASENPKASFGGTLTKSGLYTARGIKSTRKQPRLLNSTRITAISDFDDIPDAEFSHFRQQSQLFCIFSQNNSTIEDLRKENESIKDIWVGCETNLPIYQEWVLTYCMLLCSSGCNDRIFKVLPPNHANLKCGTLIISFFMILIGFETQFDELL